MTDGELRFTQATIFFAVFGATMWLGIHFEYELNPYFPLAYGFMAAYGFTIARMKLRSYLYRRSLARTARSTGIGQYGQPNSELPGPSVAGLRESHESLAIFRRGDQSGNLIDVTPEPPTLNDVKRLPRP